MDASKAYEPDPLLPGVRRLVWAAFLLAIANGLFLYVLPQRAETDYAWAIRPPVSAAFLGAGYLSGIVATGLVLFVARYWRSVRPLGWPFFVLAVVLLAATLLHADRFRWGYALTWLWTAVYAVIPVAVVWAWWRQARRASAPVPADARLAPVVVLSWPLAVVLLLWGVLLFVAPEGYLDAWPWPITPLLARAFAGWYLLMGGFLLAGALTVRQAHEVPIAYATVAVWSGLLLPLPLLYAGSMRAGTLGYWLWLGLHLTLIVVAGWAVLYAVRLMRAGGQHL